MTDIPFKKSINHGYGGVDRCSSGNEAIGEATIVCERVVNEAAQAMGATVKNNSVDIDLKHHSHKNKKNWKGERSCSANIQFDCKATLVI